MFIQARVVEVLPKTSFKGREGQVDVQPVIFQSISGAFYAELLDKTITSWEQTGIKVGDRVHLLCSLSLSDWDSKTSGAKMYKNNIRVTQFFSF